MAKIQTNPELERLMEETVVVRAVDDGDGVVLEAPINDVQGPYESEVEFKHWAQGEGLNEESLASAKLKLLRDGAKEGLAAVQAKVKKNPYGYALAAAGLGFVIGRLVMSRRQSAVKHDLSQFRDSPSKHTGVHVRRESRFANAAR